jgi:hypothetical protein
LNSFFLETLLQITADFSRIMTLFGQKVLKAV